ncbi:hypothetical protein [Erythrobacter sp. HL-111]|uniref:PAS domain-containing protein n=1 Tax=Erythrobacter sp. HL-111 TaxID=1798193 RepID=UPI0006DAE649|nr:hypothetical protein [Erythrobacter sp. HL-111]KPP85851.1 MAG: hypothetical protein HLUCCO15_13345 [Erythrobacteraceae bacterium HL-111]SDS79575.1 hypothetical protein SAMN04515621_2248 [Erythrobacter sp. HL-111]
MDNLRGMFESGEPGEADAADPASLGPAPAGASDGWDGDESGPGSRDIPPHAIGQDERRMQVRAYNHWASLLDEKSFPSIEDLVPEALTDFGPHSVLLDFTAGIDDPVVQYLGDRLAEECGATGPIRTLADVPPRSLLSRITDHYMQILANEAPIGFEAEFVNQRGLAILYRGILLPFSSDGETIDFIYGVINWKEMADALTSDELLLEIDQALETAEEPEVEARVNHADPLTEWADSPLHESEAEDEPPAGDVFDLDGRGFAVEDPLAPRGRSLPLPDFGQYALDDPEDEEEYWDEDEGGDGDGDAPYHFASLADYIEAPAKKAIDLEAENFDPEDYRVENFEGAGAQAARGWNEPEGEPEFEASELPADAGLADCLASARELARAARSSEDRSRNALYAAVGRAYDFSLAAADAPEEFAELVAEAGLAVQDRAPMTPVVKLVFGADYDKTRLTEYAAVLSHAHRLGLERGALAGFLGEVEGGLKAVVQAERRLRREEAGKPVETADGVREALAEKLRELEAMMFEALSPDGPEFGLVMIRRDETGTVHVLGEIEEDIPLIERAARKLVG